MLYRRIIPNCWCYARLVTEITIRTLAVAGCLPSFQVKCLFSSPPFCRQNATVKTVWRKTCIQETKWSMLIFRRIVFRLVSVGAMCLLSPRSPRTPELTTVDDEAFVPITVGML